MRETDRSVFHTATIGGRTFIASMSSEGPYLGPSDGGTDRIGNGVTLGTATFLDIDDGDVWNVFKHDIRQFRFTLSGMDDENVGRVAGEFGIRVGIDPGPHSFFESRAWAGLRNWVAANPSLAKDLAGRDRYLPGWYARANRENLGRRSAA